jgi:hypothetical protein
MASGADRDSNTGQLDWLDAHQVGLGEVPAQFARYVADLGPAGIAQARDFVEQFARRRPDERDALVDGILDRLDPQAQASFLGAPRPQGQPFGTCVAGARNAFHRYDEELPDHLTRRTLELRKGEEGGGVLAMAAANGADGDDSANDPQVAEGKRFAPNDAKHDKFFDDYSALAEKLAKELDTNPKYILSLMSLEGGWGDKGSREKNNPFGFKKGDVKLQFESTDAAGELFKKVWGKSVEGARSIDEFVNGLQDQKIINRRYNTDSDSNPEFDDKREIRRQHETIIRRFENWRSGRSS